MRLGKDQLKPFIDKAAFDFKVNKNLIFSIVMAESGADPMAIRYEPGWKYIYQADKFAKKARITEATEVVLQSSSIGLMQVMGTVARELGHDENLLMLTYPSVGVHYGTKKLKELVAKYETLEDVISAYNMGTARKDENGDYINQRYVNRVKEFMAREHF